LRYIILPC